MRALRVAIVAPSLRILGGQAVQAERLLQAWQADPDVEAWLVPVNPAPIKPLRWTGQVKYVRTVVTELTYVPLLLRELARADIVHVFSASYWSFLLAPLPALLVARALGRPVILNYRSGEAADHLARSTIARAALARVDRNVVPSQFLVDVFEHFGVAATVIPNIVDLDRFQYRARIPLRPRLVSTRNFDDLYNVACTLRAFRIVQRQRPDATLTLVGGGARERDLRALAATLELRNVTFVGRVRPEEIAAIYAAHDVYIQSPNIDNMPASVLEAFASGLPVASTDAGGIPCVVRDQHNGLLAPVDDHEALAARVLRLLEDPVFAQQLARTARESCDAYTWRTVRRQWLDLYRSALSSTDVAVGRPVGTADGSRPRSQRRAV